MLLALFSVNTGISLAADNYRDKTVHIECSSDSEPKRKSIGTGVLVSQKGHVLTQKDLIDHTKKCWGSVGNAFNGKKKLLIRRLHTRYDAVLLQFVDAVVKSYHFMEYCDFDHTFHGKEILAAGYPVVSDTGNASPRTGIVSSVIPNESGFIETTAPISSGYAGGPVMLSNTGELLGIITGANFDQGSYWFLPVSSIATQFEFERFDNRSNSSCTGRKPNKMFVWSSDVGGELDLEMAIGEGFCFFTRHTGSHNNDLDFIAIEEKNGKYVLVGGSDGRGKHSHEVTCRYTD